MTTNPVLVRPVISWPWWRDLAERLARQGLQAVAPVLLAVTAAAGHVDVAATAVTMAGVFAFTLIKGMVVAVAEVPAVTGGGVLSLAYSRVLPAFAGVVLGFLPPSWSGMLDVDWRAVVVAAAAAAGTAAVTAVVAPAVPTVAGRAGLTLTT